MCRLTEPNKILLSDTTNAMDYKPVCGESARSLLLSILCSLFLVRQKVAIVGGGVIGSLLAHELSSKLGQNELVLVEAGPGTIWLIAGARVGRKGSLSSSWVGGGGSRRVFFIKTADL